MKALVYYDHMCRLDVQNDKGDTALHMAARWGYEGIIQVLLENGASTDLLNRNKDSPLHCALNSKVRKIQRFRDDFSKKNNSFSTSNILDDYIKHNKIKGHFHLIVTFLYNSEH